METYMNYHLILAIFLFVTTYFFILTEKFNRTTIAMFGAILTLVFFVEDNRFALGSIDFNTVALLIGMMVIVNIMKKTGVFEYVAIYAAKLVKGNPWAILVLLSILTAISSAILDNVTTILLVAPVTIVLAKNLELNPIPFIMSEVLLSNIGGSSTLIGDPPNILIGSASGFGFNDFLINMMPVIFLVVIVNLFVLKIAYKKKLNSSEESRNAIMKMDEKLLIKDKSLLIKSVIVLVITIIGFLTHQSLGYESSTVAMFGASLLLLISKLDPEEILAEIEWPTIFFFIALFVLVGALEKVGVIEFLARSTINLTGGNLKLTVMFVLWGSAIASAFLDNIPFVASMIPIIKDMGEIGGLDTTPLWWALALGACLGGNGTIIGASANVVAAGLLDKYSYKMSFKQFMKIGMPVMFVSIVISSIYLFVRYL